MLKNLNITIKSHKYLKVFLRKRDLKSSIILMLEFNAYLKYDIRHHVKKKNLSMFQYHIPYKASYNSQRFNLMYLNSEILDTSNLIDALK